MVHKTLICHNSRFFNGALDKKCEEGKTGVINMAEDNPEVFVLYVSWLYGQSLYLSGGPIYSATSTTPMNHWDVYENWTSAFVFGDRILDDDFCDAIVDATLRYAENTTVWPSWQLEKILKICPVESPPHRLMIDVFVYRANSTWIKMGELSPRRCTADTWMEICRGLLAGRDKFSKDRTDWPWVKNPCVYHRHAMPGGGSCYRSRSGMRNWLG